MIKQVVKFTVLAAVGGIIYAFLEILYRGYTHWSMVILGGIAFILVGLINEWIPWSMPFLVQMVCGGIIITALEYVAGCILNLRLGWKIWDYSQELFNIKGQICMKYSILWCFVSSIAIFLDDYLRWKWFKEDKPSYTLF